MKKIILLLLLPVMLVLTAAVLAPKLASESRLRGEVEAMLRVATGEDPSIGGSVSFAVLPWPTIVAERLSVGDAQARLVAGEARIVLDLLPLLTGQARADLIELEDAEIFLKTPEGGTDMVGALAAVLGAARSRADIHVVSGVLHLVDGDEDARAGSVEDEPSRGDETDISLKDMRVGWRGGREVTAKGRVVWRDEPLDVAVSLSDLGALVTGGAGKLRLSFEGAALGLAFDGGMRLAGGPVLNGGLTVSSRQLRDTMEWLGLEVPLERGLGPFALNGAAHVSGQGVTLASARIELDGNAGVGGFNLRFDGKRTIVQGSLASEMLDLTPYGEVMLAEVREQDWSGEDIDLHRVNALDVDLRLSATKVRLSGVELQRMAASATLKAGKLSLAIGEAEAWNGIVRGALRLSPLEGTSGADMRLDLAADDVDLARALGDLLGIQRLEGKGTFRLAVSGSGASVVRIVDDLGGEFSLESAQGALVGIDIARILERLDKRPLSGGGDLLGGRTSYDVFDIEAKIQSGVAHVERIALTNSRLRVTLAGESALARRSLDLNGMAQLVGTGDAKAAGSAATGASTTGSATTGSGTPAEAAVPVLFELPFVVRGGWERPLILPDPQALIRRSGAARPLLPPPEALNVVIPAP